MLLRLQTTQQSQYHLTKLVQVLLQAQQVLLQMPKRQAMQQLPAAQALVTANNNWFDGKHVG